MGSGRHSSVGYHTWAALQETELGTFLARIFLVCEVSEAGNLMVTGIEKGDWQNTRKQESMLSIN